jgi:SAM-dependent methyltransferase
MTPQRTATGSARMEPVHHHRPSRPSWFIIARGICENLRVKARSAFGLVEESYGSTHRDWPVAKSLAYLDRILDDYLRYGGISADVVQGKTIVEVGPGDNLGLALKLLSLGARRVIALYKYYSQRNADTERHIYSVLRERCTPAERKRFDEAIDLTRGAQPNPEKLLYRYGVGIEDADSVLLPQSCDLILSRAVLMEIRDLDRAFEVMDRALRPGGMMIHKIAPLHDYKLFTNHGYNPLEFLTISEPVYDAMAGHAGKPNRRLVDFYRAKMAQVGYRSTVHITSAIGRKAPDFPPGTLALELGKHYDPQTLASVEEIRPRLAPAFRQKTNEELMIESFFLTATKP